MPNVPRELREKTEPMTLPERANLLIESEMAPVRTKMEAIAARREVLQSELAALDQQEVENAGNLAALFATRQQLAAGTDTQREAFIREHLLAKSTIKARSMVEQLGAGHKSEVLQRIMDDLGRVPELIAAILIPDVATKLPISKDQFLEAMHHSFFGQKELPATVQGCIARGYLPDNEATAESVANLAAAFKTYEKERHARMATRREAQKQ